MKPVSETITCCNECSQDLLCKYWDYDCLTQTCTFYAQTLIYTELRNNLTNILLQSRNEYVAGIFKEQK
jgi:hypothetical protein